MLKQVSGLVFQRAVLSVVICGTPSAPDRLAVSQRRAAAGSVTFEHQVPHARLAVAAQDVALHVGGIERGAHQPTPNFWRTWAAE